MNQYDTNEAPQQHSAPHNSTLAAGLINPRLFIAADPVGSIAEHVRRAGPLGRVANPKNRAGRLRGFAPYHISSDPVVGRPASRLSEAGLGKARQGL
jgi:hypothetical protein